ncbi:TetR/AcrR family transcriptional regulator [Nocardia suismassiliense]|uniref:TetR/AcrR family transcriptional regulator n=1 Tax=Nocardia suismassiliense TaxID=2077092 RepID=A0ABW6R2T1_9NOCA
MSTTDRRALIADAAIELVATQGIRALTHRGIDAALGLPAGSSSYYFRTKRALIEAIVDRITARSRADFIAAQLTPAGPVDPEATAHGIASWLDRLLSERRSHLIARHTLILELLSDPDLHARLAHSLFSTERARDLFDAMDCADPSTTAADFVALLEGAVFDRFAGSRADLAPGTPESVRQLSTLLGSFLRGVGP